LKSILVADEKADIAILQFDATETPSVVGLGDSDRLQVGEEVYAIGTPAGLEGTVSTGNISNPARRINGRSFIQFTAPISPGSSGGALFNRGNEVVGVTAAIWNIPSWPQAGSAQNLNLAAPINIYKEVLTGGATSLLRESPALYYSLGNLADDKKEWDKAIKYYKRALSLDDKYADAYLGLGDNYYEKGDFELEVQNYEKATHADPQNRDTFYHLGTAYEDVGKYEEAVAAYQRALKIDPRYKDALRDLAILYAAQGKLDEARTLLPRLSAADRGRGNALQMLLERMSVATP
jgi:tetratricopeptide (TPR) repeat protein